VDGEEVIFPFALRMNIEEVNTDINNVVKADFRSLAFPLSLYIYSATIYSQLLSILNLAPHTCIFLQFTFILKASIRGSGPVTPAA
jgi:hypothetical protein